MTDPKHESEFIFGIHEPGGEHLMMAAGHPGWILFTEGVGADPANQSGRDYSEYSGQGYGIICRLNYGYYPQGTIPHSGQYADFATRCANFVANSRGCTVWIIGNEMNFALERPHGPFLAEDARGAPTGESASGSRAEPEGESADRTQRPSFLGWAERPLSRLLQSISGGMGDAALGGPSVSPPSTREAEADEAPETHEDLGPRSHPQRFNALRSGGAEKEPGEPLRQHQEMGEDVSGQVITPQRYVDCYRLCRDAIHGRPGHEGDQVLVGAVAPWNNQTAYPGNPTGDWVTYLADILSLLGPSDCDGLALHTYTHQADPALIYSDAKMDPPFTNRHYEFRAYQDFMRAIPANMRHLPVYLSETDQDVAWLNQNNGWVQRAYGEIDFWNRQPGNQQIRALVLYRWPKIDRWYIEGKEGVISDFRDALRFDYRWRPDLPLAEFAPGDLLETAADVNLRQTPGYQEKPQDDVLTTLPAGTTVRVLNIPPQQVDGLFWWGVEVVDPSLEPPLQGWLAQNSPAGVPLLYRVDTPVTEGIGVGSRVRTLTTVRMRATPGTADKPASDVIAEVPPDVEGMVVGGPQNVDGLIWWLVRTVDSDRQAVQGWMAEADGAGVPLLEELGEFEPPSIPGGGQSSTFSPGDSAVTLDYVRVRRTAGYVGKDSSDIVQDVAPGTIGVVLGGPQLQDELTWWNLRLQVEDGEITGWAAETAPNGVQLLAPVEEPDPPEPSSAFRVGELVQAADFVRVRRTPGYSNKPADDVVGALAPKATMNIIAGPREADGLTWWRVGGISQPAGELVGWVAESTPNGIALMQRPPKLAGTNIPDPINGHYLGAPFRSRYGISQLWGENPDIYGQFSYDDVPLQGHNGIDFLTPNGTELQAVDNGVVAEVVFNDPSGFGHYVKLLHGWGESLYAHMQDISVNQGQSVSRGDRLGHSDNTGYSGGPHLHFTVRINPYERSDGWGGFSDPLPYMNPKDYELPAYVLDGPVAAAAAAPMALQAVQRLASGAGLAPDHPSVRRP